MEATGNPKTSPTIPPAPTSHLFNNHSLPPDSRPTSTYDNGGMNTNNTATAVQPSSSDSNVFTLQQQQPYGSISYQHQLNQRQQMDYNNQQQPWMSYHPYQAYQMPYTSQLQMAPPLSMAPPPQGQNNNNGIQLTDLNNNQPAEATISESSQTKFNASVLKSILESEQVQEAIRDICKVAVEAAIDEIKSSLPQEDKSSKVTFVRVKTKGGREFDWQVTEKVFDELSNIRKRQTMVKAVLVQLHPIPALRQMLLTGDGRKHKNSTKLPDRSVDIVTASMIKYLWRKGKEFLENPDLYQLDHMEFCQSVRTLISKSLQWFKENYDSDGHRLPVTNKKKTPPNSSVSLSSKKASSSLNSSTSSRGDSNDESDESSSSDDDHIDMEEDDNSTQSNAAGGHLKKSSSAGIFGANTGHAIPIAGKPQPKVKPTLQPTVTMEAIDIPPVFTKEGASGPRRSTKKPKSSSTATKSPSKANKSKGPSRKKDDVHPSPAHSRVHSPMSPKNFRGHTLEKTAQGTSKGKENTLRTPRPTSPIIKRPSGTSTLHQRQMSPPATPNIELARGNQHDYPRDSQTSIPDSQFSSASHVDQYHDPLNGWIS